MIIYIGLLGIISLILVMFLHLTGMAGVVGLGTTLVAADLFWQGLRLKLFVKNKEAGVMMVVLLFGVRVVSIAVLIALGHSWLAPRYFSILTAIVLTLPVWTVFGAYGFKRERY
jgi:hypothetical protein